MAVTITDPGYPPPLLGETVDPPVLLFARGRVDLLQSTAFDVVGTRRPTPYGMAAAERLSGDLARAGLTIVSGMARGIDTASQKARWPRKAIPSQFWDAAWMWVPRGEPQSGWTTGVQGADYFRVPDGVGRGSAKFPHSQPYYQRNERRPAGG